MIVILRKKVSNFDEVHSSDFEKMRFLPLDLTTLRYIHGQKSNRYTNAYLLLIWASNVCIIYECAMYHYYYLHVFVFSCCLQM